MSSTFGAPPGPDDATDPAEFVMALGRLRQWSGLSYRQLAAKAEASGDVLPPSTAVGALSRAALPREELVAAFVRACGVDEAAVAHWAAVRRHIAASAAPRPPLPVEEAGGARSIAEPQRDDILRPADPRAEERGLSDQGSPDQGSPVPDAPASSGSSPSTRGSSLPGSSGRTSAVTDPAGPASGGPAVVIPADTGAWRRRPVVVVIVAVLAVVGVAATALRGSFAVGSGSSPTPGSSLPAPAPSSSFPGSVLADGWYRISPSHVADRDMCVGEGRERNGRTTRELAVQRPCRGLSPDTYLRAVGRDVYQIEWHHPVHGVGCLTVDHARDSNEALIGPANCTGAAYQRFLLEQAGPRATGGFVLRPLHTSRCVGILSGVADVDVGAELAQNDCTGKGDQVFLFTSASAPTTAPKPAG